MSPYALLIIKPMSVGRGEAPDILADILNDCPLRLAKFRAWEICDTTLCALCREDADTDLEYEIEKIHLVRHIASWVCLFVSKDVNEDPFTILSDYCGPLDLQLQGSEHLRYRYGGYKRIGKTAHPSDNVVHLSKPQYAEYDANMLFLDFDKDYI